MRKKRRRWLIAGAGLVLCLSALIGLYRTSIAGPPELYVNGTKMVIMSPGWSIPQNKSATDPGELTQIENTEKNIVTVSIGDELKLRNKLPWVGKRQIVQITLFDADTHTCYASWPLDWYSTLAEGRAEPGSYYMELMVVYRSLFASGHAYYGAILNVE